MKTGLYVHIPFCLSRCAYCNFCSYTVREYGAYADALAEELALRSVAEKIDTVYFGGGTPSILPESAMGKIMEAVRRNFDIDKNAEITVECNPASADGQKIKFLKSLGFNRFSLGLQCANDEILSAMGRPHDTKDFCTTVESFLKEGLTNISADVMLGLPEQTFDDLDSTLDLIEKYSIPHVSAYALKLERGTTLRRLVKSGKITLPDDDQTADMYDRAKARLEQMGILRYEVSNFAKIGFESRHNLIYWNSFPYIGAGCSAHGYYGGARYSNLKNLRKYIVRLNNGLLPVLQSKRQTLGEEKFDFVMLALRLDKGLEKNEFQGRFGADFFESYPKVKALLEKGVLSDDGGFVKVDEKFTYVLNDVLVEMLFD